MNTYSAASLAHLETCHPDLRALFEEVIKHRDCTIIEGHRSDERQEELWRTGASKLGPGQSKHNRSPSGAVDAGPYFPGEGIPWNDRERWLTWGGFVLGVAAVLGIKIRAGSDWDGDWLHSDQSFHDMPHFELED
jgi:peptidoglycan L-alanyl-D-glutamate endopeptidase CwlK